MLVEAGDNEKTTDGRGRTAFDIVYTIGSKFMQTGIRPGRVRRMLAQAPAFRARSRTWPDAVATSVEASETVVVEESFHKKKERERPRVRRGRRKYRGGPCLCLGPFKSGWDSI